MGGNNSNVKRYYPPGPRTDPLPHLYDLFYQFQDESGNTVSALQSQVSTLQSAANNNSQAPLIWPTKWTDQTGKRAFASVYSNPSPTLPMIVLVTVALVTASQVTAFSDGSPTPTFELATVVSAISGPQTVVLPFVVLPNNYYKVTNPGSAATITKWVEGN